MNRGVDLELDSERESLPLKRKALEAVLHQCHEALQFINTTTDAASHEHVSDAHSAAKSPADSESDQLCDLLKSRAECPAFLAKLEYAHASASSHDTPEGNAWDMVSANDLWEGEDVDSNLEDYVLVGQEDIADGIACFMAAYMLSLKQTKDLTPIELQEALRKTFTMKKRKGKLQKAWDGGKVIYNVASWGATAIGIYQNPVIISAATKAFWSSYQVISKLL